MLPRFSRLPVTASRILIVLFLCFSYLLSAQPKQTPPANNEKEFQEQYKIRITKDKLNNVYIPKNLEDAFLQLNKLIDPDAKKKFMDLPENKVVETMHDRLGRWMIMNWGFLGGSRLSHYLKSGGVTYPDDQADLLLITYHRKLHSKPLGFKELAIGFKKMRHEEYEEEIRSGEVIYEETRKKN